MRFNRRQNTVKSFFCQSLFYRSGWLISLRGANNFESCVNCIEGYYGTSYSNEQCTKCPANATSQVGAMTVVDCLCSGNTVDSVHYCAAHNLLSTHFRVLIMHFFADTFCVQFTVGRGYCIPRHK